MGLPRGDNPSLNPFAGVGTCDITRLPGPRKWVIHPLYVVLDLFSCCVVAWMVATRESATRANRLIAKACRNQSIQPGQLTLHQDHGAPTCLCLWHARRQVTAKSFSQLPINPNILASYSRPRVSDDNPYPESQYKALKYAPSYAGHFSGPQDARTYFQAFFPWYNTQHGHSGLGLLTECARLVISVRPRHICSMLQPLQQCVMIQTELDFSPV